MPTCLITGRRRQMTKDILEGNWKVYTNNILQHWDKLTKDDLQRTGGERESLAAKLQERYGIGKVEAEEQIQDFENRYKSL
jgi:uncharacterized protein YjbJ (UPF0337 family)